MTDALALLLLLVTGIFLTFRAALSLLLSSLSSTHSERDPGTCIDLKNTTTTTTRAGGQRNGTQRRWQQRRDLGNARHKWDNGHSEYVGYKEIPNFHSLKLGPQLPFMNSQHKISTTFLLIPGWLFLVFSPSIFELGSLCVGVFALATIPEAFLFS